MIIGEKPLFDIQETASRRNVNQADIQASAVQNVQSVVAMQPGVVMADNEIHIRGGRTYENAYLLDGISVQDPMAGSGFGLQLSPSSIQEVEVITGGYNAEYGQATSGIVNITTREGSDRYSGSFGYKTDHFGFNNDSRSNWNTDIYDLNLSGPEPITSYLLPALGVQVPGSVSFFGTVYANLTDGYTRWVQPVGLDRQPSGWIVAAPGGLYSSIFHGVHLGTETEQQLFVADEADMETQFHDEALVCLQPVCGDRPEYPGNSGHAGACRAQSGISVRSFSSSLTAPRRSRRSICSIHSRGCTP